MPRKPATIRKTKSADETRAWVLELVRQPPKAFGVTAGAHKGEAWGLAVLWRYIKEHGPKQGHRQVSDERLRLWLSAPELEGKLPYWKPGSTSSGVKAAKDAKEPQRQRLAAAVRGIITKANGSHGGMTCGLDDAPSAKVTLPNVFFASRPEIRQSDRERFGKDFKPPAAPSVTERRLKDDEVIAAGEAALRRIRGARPMVDWIAIGRALLVLRQRAMAKTDAKKPRGVLYVRRNRALLRQHGFLAISKSARQTAMLVVENLPAIEEWLTRLPEESGLSLHHPMVIWRGYLAAKKRNEETTSISEGAWRSRRFMREEDFAKVVQAIAETLPSQDPITIAVAVVRSLGYAVPRKFYCGREIVTPPPMPWSPFVLSL